MKSFSDLKNNKQDSLDKLSKYLTELNTKQFSDDDDRMWYPAVDKTGNGSAIIRFLPAPDGEDVPFVRVFTHGFKGPTGLWYIENSLTTIGKQDPVGEMNSQLWDSGSEANKQLARDRKRRLNFISNVYIVKDPTNPENEGKVKLYRYGKKIFDKLNEMMNPSFDDDPKVNPFDLWEGTNFRLRIRTVDKFRNYDKSDFEKPSSLFKDDKKLEEVWKSEHSLQEFVSPDKFKSYSELKARLVRVLGLDRPEEDIPFDVAEEAPPAEQPSSVMDKAPTTEEEDDDTFKMFQQLAD